MNAAIIIALCAVAAPALGQSPSWTPVTPALSDSRWAPSAALLPGGGTALVAGGYSFDASSCVSTADIFDKAANKFHRAAGRLTYPRDFATANVLADGTVLISGGYNTTLGSLATAEVFDPRTERFHVLDSRMSKPRELFSATTMADGRILLVGGFNTHRGRTLATADLYDPKTQTFSQAPSRMSEDRFGQAAVLLRDGRVLLTGGKHWFVGKPDRFLATAELFDPVTNTFRSTKSPMSTPRDRPTLSLLADGTVLIAGGQNGGSGVLTAEIYDPATDEFHVLPHKMLTPRMAHGAETLPDGRILFTGGWSPEAHVTTGAAELFDPATGAFTSAPDMAASGHDQAFVVFPDGSALVAGGKQVEQGKESSLASAFLLKP